MKHLIPFIAFTTLLLAGCLSDTGTDTATGSDPQSSGSSAIDTSAALPSSLSEVDPSSSSTDASYSSSRIVDCVAYMYDTIVGFRELMGDGSVDTTWFSDLGHCDGVSWSVDSSGYHVGIAGTPCDSMSHVAMLKYELCPSFSPFSPVIYSDTIRLNFGPDSLTPLVSRDIVWPELDSLRSVLLALDSGNCTVIDLPGSSGLDITLFDAPEGVQLWNQFGCANYTLECSEGITWEQPAACIDFFFDGSAHFPLTSSPWHGQSYLAIPDSASIDSTPWGLVASNPYGFTDTLWVVPPTQP